MAPAITNPWQHGNTSKLHVLVVEDNPDGRESLRALLQAWGHNVEVAAHGLEGIQKVLAGPPQVALVDINMPYLDGYGFAEQVRAALGEKVCLAACTAYGRPEDRRRALEAGFDAHFVKPVDLDALEEWLTHLPFATA